ncbi:beta-galactosidase trimerization domain-containing protein, partial [bacterium]|nr:beta-galactosidase trimerization domain-containing protein [bacterium]
GGASVLNKKSVPWDFDIQQELRYQLGLNTIPSNALDVNYIDKMVEWWEKRKAPLIKKSLSYQHNQNIDRVVKMINDKKLNDYFYYLSYGDEIGLPRINPSDKEVVAEFISFLKENGETPQSLGFKSWDKIKPLNSVSPDVAVKIGVLPESQKETKSSEIKLKKLYWYTLKFQEKKGIEIFAEKTKKLREELGKEVHTTANLGGMHPFYWMSQTSFIESFKNNAMTIAWSEPYAWAMPEASNLVVDFEASYLRKGSSYHSTPMMFYCMPHFPGNNPENFLQTAAILWMNDVKDLDFFSAGPDAFFTENYISYRYGMGMFKMIRKISEIAGLIENQLLPAKVKETPVALLISQASDIWELDGKGQWAVKPGSKGTNVFQEERKAIWYALRRAGYRVDILTENDLKDGLADEYKIIYMAGQNIEKKAAEKLKEWVRNGGILFATSGAGRKDEFDQPFKIIDELTGRGEVKSLKRYYGPLRAKLELLFEKPVDKINFENSSLDILCVKEEFAPEKSAEILGKYISDGNPAVIKNNYGKGEVYYCGFLPGLSYIKKGLKKLPMGKGGGNQNFCHSGAHHFEIENPDKTAERIILLPLNEAGIKPDVISEKGVVCGRLESPSSTVIPVINLSKAKLKNVSIEVKNLKRCRRVWSPFFREGLKYKKLKNEVVITIPELKSADMIIIER